MSKYRELPQKPRSVYAIQYLGLKDGVPTFNEPAPHWVMAALAKGRMAVAEGVLFVQSLPTDMGQWILIEEDMNVDGIWTNSDVGFHGKYVLARKKSVRKPSAAEKADVKEAA